MIGYRAVRDLFNGRLQEAQDSNAPRAAGRVAALRDFHDMIGLESGPGGQPMIPLDERGLPSLKPGSARMSEFSVRHVAEAILGHEFVEEYYHPNSGFDFGLSRHLQEAAVDPSVFVDINTFNLSIAGLINAEIMTRFVAPEYLGKSLFTIKPTKMNGQKLVGISGIRPQTKVAKGRQPGEQHEEVGPGSAYQTTPETVEQALKCILTRESVFFDLTGDLTEAAGGVGDECAYGMEKDMADCVLGVTSTYNRNGTSYTTYQTATPYINTFANPFSDETDVDDARQLFVGMTDPETGREIRCEGRTILCMPARELKFRQQLFGSNVQIGTQAAGNFPARYKDTTVKIDQMGAKGAYDVIALSAIWYNRATAADGLALSASDAKELWFVGDFQNAFWWMENWPLTPWQANADEYVLKDRGLIAVYGANYRGAAVVREPRRVVKNTAS